MIEYIFSPQSVEALGWTLLHSLWQGGVFAILLVLILIVLRSYSAQSRYVVSVGLLCAFFLTLSATFWIQWQEVNTRLELTAQQLNRQSAEDAFLLNTSTENVLSSDAEGKNMLPSSSELLVSHQPSWLIEFRDYYDRNLPLLVTIWFLGVLFLQLRLLGQLAYVQRLKHYGVRLFPTTWNDKIKELEGKLRIQKKVRYLTSIRVESPMVIGWLKPVVLMPQQLFNSLSETEIYAVLAHELAHIRREDFIVNLIQTFLCNLFFFHPGVWWMSNRIDDEREHCCDDLAVVASGQVTSYAKTLINVSELQLKMQRNTPLAMALSGKRKKQGGFSDRIRRLFMVSNGAGTFREGFATAFILMTALFLGVAATESTVKDTELTTTSEIIKTETISNNEIPISSELIQNTQKSSTAEMESNPISNISQAIDLNELPVAEPAISANPEEAASPVKSEETRIDALVMACKEGDIDFVKTLVNLGIDIDGIGSEGFTPLMTATSRQEAEIVEYLLKQGADVNQTYNGWTALHEAADEGSLTSMKHLLEAGAEVNFYWVQGSPTAISMAASEGNLDCLKLLLEYGANINGIGKSVPPLHIAVEEDKRAIIKYLISQKVNINKKDAAGRTALMYGASEGQKYSVKLLIEAGADISIVDANGDTAIDYEEQEEKYSIRDYLDEQDEDDSDYSGANKRPWIHQATLDGLIEKVQRMVEQGTDVNTKDDYGRTPLHIASAEGNNIDMRVLIDLGADINAQDNQGRTPLMYAAADGKGDAVALLVSKVADVNIKDVDGMRAYEWARSGGNSELAKFLGLITKRKSRVDKNDQRWDPRAKEYEKRWENKNKRLEKKEQRSQNDFHSDVRTNVRIDVRTDSDSNIHESTTTENGQRETFHITPDGTHLRQFDIKEKNAALLKAARSGSVQDIIQLLENDQTVNNADATGQTALMVASRSNRLDIAKILIEQGADVNMSSASGLTALHYAALENHDRIAQLLLENNAIVDATMRYSSTDGNYGKEPLVWEYVGATPLLIAVESRSTEVISILIDAGANKNYTLIRNEYKLNKDRETYLTGSEVMGLDGDFLEEVEIQISDNTWTPYKQALLLNKPEILALFRL